MSKKNMIVYHGGYCEIQTPEIIKWRYTKDFGSGFYCTEIKEQAKRWSERYDTSLINVYKYTADESIILQLEILIMFLTASIMFLLIGI